MESKVFVFNPLAEGYIAHGKGFAPVKHQALLVQDLANLPQFLCTSNDIVLLDKRPSKEFLNGLSRAGLPLPEFIELRDGHIDPAWGLARRRLHSLRPWAWGPDSVELLDSLFNQVINGYRHASQCYNGEIARLYSKAWSAAFLKKVLAGSLASSSGNKVSHSGTTPTTASWCCTEQEVGTSVDNLEDALREIAAIRDRGHLRVVVKEAHGLAGHNAIRLWEPEILPSHRQWLTRALAGGRQLVVEPWLEREMDFSIQLEMERGGLLLRGYTGLVNDLKGQFQANWAEANHTQDAPEQVVSLLGKTADRSNALHRLYGDVFTFLEAELRRVGFLGPISIDALVYRTPQGERRLKPVVEINPRYTMGRLTLDLMQNVTPGSSGLMRLITRTQAAKSGYPDLASYARSLCNRTGLSLGGGSWSGIREGAICLNDPQKAQVCLATFEVSPTPGPPDSLLGLSHTSFSSCRS